MTKVAVIGAGTMGHGIAHVAALAGYETALTDAVPGVLDTAKRNIERTLEGGVSRGKVSVEQAVEASRRIRYESTLDDAVRDADLVIEAIVEDLEVKGTLFARLAASCDAGVQFRLWVTLQDFEGAQLRPAPAHQAKRGSSRGACCR